LEIKITDVPVLNHSQYYEYMWGLHAFLTLTLDGGQWSASRSGHFTPWEAHLETLWIGDQGGLQRGSGRKISGNIVNSAVGMDTSACCFGSLRLTVGGCPV